MRRVAAPIAICACCVIGLAGQSASDPRLEAQLRTLFPSASSFSVKEGDPPHFKAYVTSDTGPKVVGFAFWTTELVPLERGYDGPIKILVGMDTSAVLTGVIVVAHHEPFGPRSIDRPAFPAQFKGKSIRDPFRVGSDVDWVSRATISVTSASRAIRDSARLVAERLLAPGGGPR